MLAGTGLTEEGVEGVVSTSDGLVTRHLTIRLDAVLQAVQLPAGISDLYTGLSDVDGDTLTLKTNIKSRYNNYTSIVSQFLMIDFKANALSREVAITTRR